MANANILPGRFSCRGVVTLVEGGNRSLVLEAFFFSEKLASLDQDLRVVGAFVGLRPSERSPNSISEDKLGKFVKY